MNQKGFTLIEGLLLVIALTLIGGVGYYVYSQNEDKRNDKVSDQSNVSKQENPAEKAIQKDIPSGWVKYENQDLTFYHPGTWEATTSESNQAADIVFKDSKSTLIARLYSSKEPRIYYSSNAPFYCQLNGSEWQNYQFNDENQSGTIQNNDECRTRVKTESIHQASVYTSEGGALGQYKYSAVTSLNSKTFLVLTDYKNMDEFNTENSGTNEQLLASVNSIMEQIVRTNK